MTDLHRDMTNFHAAIAAVIQDHPSIPLGETLALRIELITEEVSRELIPALERCKHAASAEDIRLLADVADGAVDSMVVIIRRSGVRDSVHDRREKERRKAERKYPQGQGPSGDLTFDIYDYAINEVVGLIRYAEMVRNRTAMLARQGEGVGRAHFIRADQVARDMESFGWEVGHRLVELRNDLLDSGASLGSVEE